MQTASQMLLQAEQRSRRVGEQFGAAAGGTQPRCGAQQVDPARLDEAQREQAAAEAALAEFRDALEQIEQVRAATATALAAAREAQSGADSARAKLAAEAQALAEVLAVKDGERWPPMVDALVVPDGLETALGAALGEELTSALDPDAARHWRELPPFDPPPALPEGAVALASLVRGRRRWRGPCRRLVWSMTKRLARHSSPLWRRARYWSRASGAIWRWDGYTIRAGTPTQAAVRLRQRNRLAALREQLAAGRANGGGGARRGGTRRRKRRRTPLPRSNVAAQHGTRRSNGCSARSQPRRSCTIRRRRPGRDSPRPNSRSHACRPTATKPRPRWHGRARRTRRCRTWRRCARR